jgi:hypothetical protein
MGATALPHGPIRHAILAFVAFRSQEPKREATRIVVRSGPACRTGNSRPDAEGSFAASLLPSASFHDHSHEHAHDLTQAFRPSRMLRPEELIHGAE